MAIPLPNPNNWGNFGPAISQGIASGSQMLQNLLRQRQMEQQQSQFNRQMGLKEREADIMEQLRQAQIQESLSKTAWNKMLMGQDQGAQGMPNAPMGAPQQTTQIPFKAPEQEAQITPAAQPQQGVIEIQPGNQRLAMLDRFAGIKGIPKVETHYDEDGNLITRYPSGRITATRTGKTTEEKAFSKGLGDYQSKAYGAANDALQQHNSLASNLDNVIDQITKYENAGGVIGPINSVMTRIFGNPQDQEFMGKIMAATGNIVLDAAKGIKGAFTGRDQALINSMKPNINDTFHVFSGKLANMSLLNKLAQERADKYADYIHEGMAPHKALQKAQRETDISDYQKQLDQNMALARIKEALNKNRQFDKNLINDLAMLNADFTPENITSTARKRGMKEQDVIKKIIAGINFSRG